MKNIYKTIAVIISICVAGSSSFAGGHELDEMTIVGIATSEDYAPVFTTLVTALDRAGLVEALDGHRDFTVFAPVNSAFDEAAEFLNENTDFTFTNGEDMVLNLPLDLLTTVLLYHVAPGERYSETILDSQRIRTLAKEFLFVDSEGADGSSPTIIGGTTSAELELTLIDIPAKNGVVHVVKSVLLP